MKQITFTESQWVLLQSAFTKLRLHSYNQWKDWCDNHRGILLAGLEESRYQQFKDEYYAAYKEVSDLTIFCQCQVRDVEPEPDEDYADGEGDKA